MKFEVRYDIHEDVVRFKGELSMSEVVQLKMTSYERRLVETHHNCASDHLAVLGMIFNIYEETMKNEHTSIDRPMAQEHDDPAQPT